jgi:hypothetical protein
VLKPGGRFMAMDFAAPSHSPLGHLLSIFGHSHGESVVGKVRWSPNFGQVLKIGSCS